MPQVDPLAEPARIAFAGDWHANTRWAVASVEHLAGRADVVVHLGDFGYTFDAGFLAPLDKALGRAGLPLLFVDGNHEDHELLGRFPVRGSGLRQLGEHIWHLPRGFRWTWGGVRFLACGGAHSVDRQWRVPGESWWAGETLTDDDVARCVDGGQADVLIAHDCPAGVVIPGIDDRTVPAPFPPLELLRADEHRQLLRRVVDAVRPRRIWHGHYHRQYRQEVSFGYGPVTVTGLDCDGTSLGSNIEVVDLADLGGT